MSRDFRARNETRLLRIIIGFRSSLFFEHTMTWSYEKFETRKIAEKVLKFLINFDRIIKLGKFLGNFESTGGNL